MSEHTHDLISLFSDIFIILFIIFICAWIIMYLVRDAQLQYAQHKVTRQANVESEEAGKTGKGGTLEYGEPYTVTSSDTFKFFRKDIHLEETRSGVNRGKFTTKGYVYK